VKTQVKIDSRFCGPPNSGNGGYTCGIVAKLVEGPAEVILRRPPPLNRILNIEKIEVEKLTPAVDIIENHQYPTCFVCGPQRENQDGLRIFSCPVQGAGYMAATWIPDPSLSDATGNIKNEIIWAALDCPGGWRVVHEKMRPILLGKFAVQIEGKMKPGDKCIVVAWKISEEGRKIITGTGLFSDSGRLYAKAKATWIELKPEG